MLTVGRTNAKNVGNVTILTTPMVIVVSVIRDGSGMIAV